MRLKTLLVVILAVAVAGLWSGCAKKQVVKPPEMVTPPPPAPAAETPKEEPTVRAEWESVPELDMAHFDFDKYDIRSDARDVLIKNAEYLKANPSFKILVEGHCDERGTTEYNLALGQKRASAVRDYYIKLGVDSSRIATISYGEEKPLDTASNEAAWAKNRRAETKINRGN